MNFLKRFNPATALARSGQVTAHRVFPTTGFTNIPTSETVEEERWPWYTPQSFYPVRIGEVLHSKYQNLAMEPPLPLGCVGIFSQCARRFLSWSKLSVTSRNEYVCMKSMVSDYTSVQREIDAYEALSKAAKTNEAPGRKYVRQALDHFELIQDDHNYHFLIHEPLGVSVQLYLNISGGSLPTYYVKDMVSQILSALEFTHSANVIHADLQAKNILLRIDDPTVLKDSEEAEFTNPSSRKFTEQTTIFETRDLPGPLRRWIGGNSEPVLCDFGEARTGDDSYTQHIQPAPYRAPEVFLHLPWTTAVDIWNFGCMMWDFMFGHQLFSRKGESDEQTADKNQLARMVALLGPPPSQLLADSGPRALEFFNEDGQPKGEVPNETLESALASSLEQAKKSMTAEESEAFLAFIRCTLTWTEEKRVSASELLKDPWIARVN